MHDHRIAHGPGDLTRRDALQVGFSGFLGLGAGRRSGGRGSAAPSQSRGRVRSVVLVFLTGAPAHQDMWDLKPEGPSSTRGEFRPWQPMFPAWRLALTCRGWPIWARKIRHHSFDAALNSSTNGGRTGC
ncbi:MAG: hypothetical protein Ct9H300mP1_38470 [Planctomycetaceae bacterium]|nr:MAG: hypothetical protein Ct9H300mP1_38470 [Planctomycetaceae bacterium]